MFHLLMLVVGALSVALTTITTFAADLITADVVVYGDTSGGVTATVQASRMGKTAIVISPTGHLGGMTSSRPSTQPRWWW
ncbi:MAG: FAD-dependent oxidoreductase [Planctomycetota bacterium]